jgi:prefoldin subunit 5
MSFQTLSDQFNSVLSQYQNTYQEYISTLDSSSNTLVTVPNASFSGQNIINTMQNSSVEDCQTSCSSNTSCTGATLNNSNNNCTLSSGGGNISAIQNYTAIVQQGLYYSYQLQQLNAQLYSINQQMETLASSSETKYQKSQLSTQNKAQILQQNYDVLNQEKKEINKMVVNYETLNQAYEEGSINVTSNYYSYIALLFITLLLIFLLVKFSFNGEQRGGGNNFKSEAVFLFGVMVVFLGLSKTFNNYNGYIFISILVIAYIIAKMKLNQ